MISRCTGVVLAGGAGARLGGVPKGLLELGGRRIVDWTLDALRGAADDLLLITNDDAVRDAVAGIVVRGDVRRERGSLVGLHTALTFCNDAALVVAWDMPFLSAELLWALRCEGERASAAVIPEGPDGVEPLCAYYPKSCLDVAGRQLDGGEMRLSSFVAALPNSVIMRPEVVRRFGAPEKLFANLNTADELARVRLLIERGDDRLEAAIPSNIQ